MFGKDYDQLSPREQDRIDQLPNVAKRKKPNEKVVSVRDKAQTAFDNLSRIRTTEDKKLLGQLAAGRKGKAMRLSLQETKRRMWEASNALFSDDLEEFLRRNESVEEELRRMYWSAQPDVDEATGALDFTVQQDQRDIVLEKARTLNIPENVITERATTFDTPQVQELMDIWNRDLDELRNYWQGSNDWVGKRVGASRQATWSEFVKEKSPNKQRQLRRANPWITKATSLRTQLRDQYRRNNPEVDQILIRWEYSIEPKSKEGRELQAETFGR